MLVTSGNPTGVATPTYFSFVHHRMNEAILDKQMVRDPIKTTKMKNVWSKWRNFRSSELSTVLPPCEQSWCQQLLRRYIRGPLPAQMIWTFIDISSLLPFEVTQDFTTTVTPFGRKRKRDPTDDPKTGADIPSVYEMTILDKRQNQSFRCFMMKTAICITIIVTSRCCHTT